MRCLFQLVLASCLIAPFIPSPSAGQATGKAEIHWQGPPSCPRRALFDTQLERLLGGSLDARRPSVARVRVEEVVGDGFALRVGIDAPHGYGERDLTVATCAQAQHAAALVIATAVLEEDTTAESNYQQAALAEDARYMLRVGALLDLGTLPAATFGPSLGVFFSRDVVRGWAEARYLIARRARDTSSTLVADLELFAGALGLAGQWEVGPLAIGPCFELEVGALRARAKGELDAQDRATLWLSSSFGAVASYPQSRRRVADLGIALLASIPWLRQPFALGDEPPFYTTGPIAFRAAIWLAFDLRSKS